MPETFETVVTYGVKTVTYVAWHSPTKFTVADKILGRGRRQRRRAGGESGERGREGFSTLYTCGFRYVRYVCRDRPHLKEPSEEKRFPRYYHAAPLVASPSLRQYTGNKQAIS